MAKIAVEAVFNKMYNFTTNFIRYMYNPCPVVELSSQLS